MDILLEALAFVVAFGVVVALVTGLVLGAAYYFGTPGLVILVFFIAWGITYYCLKEQYGK